MLNFTVILILHTEPHYLAGLLIIYAVIYINLIYLNKSEGDSLTIISTDKILIYLFIYVLAVAHVLK